MRIPAAAATAFVLLGGVALAQQDPYPSEEFAVQVGERQIAAKIVVPPADRLAPDPILLINLAGSRDAALSPDAQPAVNPYYCLVPPFFLEKGHRVVSFDLPNHGVRVDQYGGSIAGLRAAFMAGEDRFAMFVDEGRAVIDECIKRGWARPGRIAVAGTSRCGYFALRLLAGDERVAAASAIAPVTDWGALDEFNAERDRQDVQALSLSHFVTGMRGKRLYLTIGDHDDRVSTAACCRFYADLVQADDPWAMHAPNVDFDITDADGHAMFADAYVRGQEFLAKWASE